MSCALGQSSTKDEEDECWRGDLRLLSQDVFELFHAHLTHCFRGVSENRQAEEISQMQERVKVGSRLYRL